MGRLAQTLGLIMIRGDLSNRLVHLTRGPSYADAASTFEQIIGTGKLLGGTGYIRGAYRCVCFSEAPLNVLAHSLAAAHEGGMRYAPFGVMVSKNWLFQQGGRPVIYESHEEFDLMHESQRFRHVRYEPHLNTDHTWEREWRIRTNELILDPSETTFIVPTRDWVNKYHALHADDMSLANYNMSIPIIEPPPWHFVVLADLGIEVVGE